MCLFIHKRCTARIHMKNEQMFSTPGSHNHDTNQEVKYFNFRLLNLVKVEVEVDLNNGIREC